MPHCVSAQCILTHVNFLHFHLGTAFPHNAYFLLSLPIQSSINKRHSAFYACSHRYDPPHSFPNLTHMLMHENVCLTVFIESLHIQLIHVVCFLWHFSGNAFGCVNIWMWVCELKSPLEAHVMLVSNKRTYSISPVWLKTRKKRCIFLPRHSICMQMRACEIFEDLKSIHIVNSKASLGIKILFIGNERREILHPTSTVFFTPLHCWQLWPEALCSWVVYL